MTGPQIRLALRAVLVGVTSLLVQLQASAAWDNALWRSAIPAALLAGLEVVTPLNATVGIAKTAHVAADPAPRRARKPNGRRRVAKKPAV